MCSPAFAKRFAQNQKEVSFSNLTDLNEFFKSSLVEKTRFTQSDEYVLLIAFEKAFHCQQSTEH